MVGKSKQRQQVAKPARKNSIPSDLDLDGENDWVMVKKQRVTILIPPLSLARKFKKPKPGTSKPKAMSLTAVNSKPTVPIETCPTIPVETCPTVPVETCPKIPSVDEQERVMSMAPNRRILNAAKAPTLQNFSALDKLRRLDLMMKSRNPDRAYSFKSRNILGLSNTSKTIKRPIPLHGPGSLLDGSMLLNQSLRASLLEKKLQRAGGLSRWLTSLGLGQFVRIFQGKCFSKFQLVNLSMKKLKDMGAEAVGPRRKLIHAIDCICQPYCFESH